MTRRLRPRGPPGWAIWLGFTVATVYGFYMVRTWCSKRGEGRGLTRRLFAACVLACLLLLAAASQIGQTNIQTRYNRKEKREARMAIVPVLQVRVAVLDSLHARGRETEKSRLSRCLLLLPLGCCAGMFTGRVRPTIV